MVRVRTTMRLLREFAEAVWRMGGMHVCYFMVMALPGIGLYQVSNWVFGKETVEGWGDTGFGLYILVAGFGFVACWEILGDHPKWLEKFRRGNRKPD